MRKSILIVLMSFLINACSDSGNEENATKIDIVTGINLVNEVGQIQGIYGNPNTFLNSIAERKDLKVTDEPLDELINTSIVTVYPTVVNDVFAISTTSGIKNVWILKGTPTKDFKDVDYIKLLSTTTHSKEEIASKSFQDFSFNTVPSITVNTSEFSKGYYRVFVAVENGDIFYENISVGHSLDGNEVDFW